jgi:hypothetical protein
MPGEAQPFLMPEPEKFTAADMEAAYATMRPEIIAILEENCPPITTDVDQAASTVWASIPRIEMAREALGRLPDILPFVDKLRTYSLGVMFAQVQIQLGGQEAPIAAWADTVGDHRDTLAEDLAPLARRGLIPGDYKEKMPPLNGHRNAADGALLLCAVARRHWAVIENKSAITVEFLTEVEQLATNVLGAIAARDARGRGIDPTGERLRAFTLMAHAYDQARRGLTFTFWGQEGRLDQTAPSLYKRGHKTKAKEAEKPVEKPVNPDAPKPVVEPAPADGPLARPFGS